MEFRVLGPIEVESDGSLLALGGAKQRALLALLLMNTNEVVSRDSLIEGLWGGAATERSGHSLEAHVSRLRKILRHADHEVLLTRPNGYMLSVGTEQLDLLVFERLLEEGRRALEAGAADDASATLRKALALWRGRAFDDVAYEPFAQIEIERLDERRLEALEDRIEADLAVGRDAQLVSELEALVRQHPLRERLRAQLMLALYRSGRQAEALDVYQDARRALVDGLGIEPEPRLRELEQSILRQDPELARAERGPGAVGRSDEQEKTVTVLFVELGAVGKGDAVDAEIVDRAIHGAGHELRVAVEYHGGTVERLTGDELMAVFGVPAAHEDDVARSARAALALRAAVAALDDKLEGPARIECRTAIATGVVRVTAASGRPELSGAVLGLARRLVETVDDGEILLDAVTAGRGGPALLTDEAEPRLLRGREEPVPVVRLLGVADDGDIRPSSTAPLVGRKHELEQLQATVDRAVEERRCVIATILGEAGIGKSRLVREFSLRLEGITPVYTGRCVSYGEGVTFLPLAEIVTQVGGTRPRDHIERLLAGEEDAALIAERVDALVGGEAEGSTGEAFWAVRRLFERAARERPLVVVFEDVHWAEPTLLDLVEYLGRWSNQASIVVLCLARPELLDRRPGWVADTSTIRLGPLSDEETMELVGQARTEIGDEVRSRIARAAAGNPLFAEQLVAFAGEEEATGLPGVPPSIEALLSSRLDRLDDSERAVLQRAAVVGREFWHGAVLHLSAPIEVPAVGRHLLELTRNGLVEPGTSAFAREDSFRFHHVLIRDVAYNSIPHELRSDLHESLVDWLDLQVALPDELAGYHLEQAHRCRLASGRDDGRARRLAADAGDRLAAAGLRASKFGDTHAASNLLGRAASLLDPTEGVRRDLLTELGLVLWRAGEVDAAEHTLSDGLDRALVAEDRRAELRARLELANLNLFRAPEGGADALLAIAAESTPVLEQLGDERALGRIWYVLAFVHGGLRCHYGESEEAAERAIESFRRSGWPVAPCVQELAASLYYGPTAVPAAIDRCGELLDETDRGGEAHVLGFLACLEAMEERFDSARALIVRAKSIYQELNWTVNLTTNYAPLAADIELLAGDPGAAERVLSESCRTLEDWGERAHLATQATQLGEALYAQSRHDEALRWADLAATRAASDDASAQFSWRTLRAKVRASQGAAIEAETLAGEAVELAAATDALSQHAAVLLARAEVLVLGDRVAEAAESIEQAIALLESKGNRAACGKARARREQLARA